MQICLEIVKKHRKKNTGPVHCFCWFAVAMHEDLSSRALSSLIQMPVQTDHPDAVSHQQALQKLSINTKLNWKSLRTDIFSYGFQTVKKPGGLLKTWRSQVQPQALPLKAGATENKGLRPELFFVFFLNKGCLFSSEVLLKTPR